MLHPAFLLAAAVNDDGLIELPAAVGGTAFPLHRALFGLDARGALVQRVVSRLGAGDDPAPLDMAFFARCLALELGPLTPDLFAIRGLGTPGSACGRLARSGPDADEARRRVLRGALTVHHVATEERVV